MYFRLLFEVFTFLSSDSQEFLNVALNSSRNVAPMFYLLRLHFIYNKNLWARFLFLSQNEVHNKQWIKH